MVICRESQLSLPFDEQGTAVVVLGRLEGRSRTHELSAFVVFVSLELKVFGNGGNQKISAPLLQHLCKGRAPSPWTKIQQTSRNLVSIFTQSLNNHTFFLGNSYFLAWL